jgi:hypothetical protein
MSPVSEADRHDRPRLCDELAIQQHDSVYARCDVAADLGEVQVHRLGIGLGQDNGRTNATRWTDR